MTEGDFVLPFKCSRIQVNLLDTAAVESYLRRYRFDALIHAANTNDFIHPELEAHQLDFNLRMFCNLERCSRLYGKLYYFGSGAEYDSTHYQDQMPEVYFGQHMPVDDYGFSKYVMAMMTSHADNIYDLRLFGVFGKHEEWRRRFISNMIYQALFGDSMCMDRPMRFDYLYVNDLARILEWFVTHEPKHHHYNVCFGKPVELCELARIIKEETGSTAEIVMSGTERKPPYSGDNSRLCEEHGELSLTPMRTGIREMITYYRETGFH